MIFVTRLPAGWHGIGRPVTDLQWVMGQRRSTTQRYLNPLPGNVVEAVLAFHARQARQDGVPVLSPGYRAESLQALFGEDAR